MTNEQLQLLRQFLSDLTSADIYSPLILCNERSPGEALIPILQAVITAASDPEPEEKGLTCFLVGDNEVTRKLQEHHCEVCMTQSTRMEFMDGKWWHVWPNGRLQCPLTESGITGEQ